MATANLKFHKVSSLPASCALGDVYYVVGKGIYVCTKEASSGATESANYTRFSYANDAASGVKGVTSLSDATNSTSSTVAATSTAVKAAYDRGSEGVNDAANALSVANSKWAQKTATQASGGTAVEGTVKGHFANTTGFSVSPIVDGVVYYKDTNTHNSHAHTFTVSGTTSTSGTATSVDVVSSIGNAAKSSGDLSSTYAKVSVPTLKVTDDLASEISKLKTVNTTGMQYKGTTADVPASGKVGDVWKCSSAIDSLGAESGDFIVCSTAGTGAAAKWDVWQANVNKDAYWDTNNPANNQIVIADGTTGKIKTTGFTTGSFALSSHNQASSTINAMTGYSKPTSASAIAAGDSLNAAIGKLEYKVDVAQSTADGKEPKTTAVRHTANTAVGSETQPVYVASNGAATACKYTIQTSVPANAVFTDTHYTATFTIKDGQSTAVAAQTFAQSAAKELVIKAAATGNLTASTSAGSANSGALTINVGVAPNYTIPSNTQISQWNAKWNKAYAQALAAGDGSKAGVATFDLSNFTVSNVGHVGLAWAEWV